MYITRKKNNIEFWERYDGVKCRVLVRMAGAVHLLKPIPSYDMFKLRSNCTRLVSIGVNYTFKFSSMRFN
jgi:hypothetical protein